MDITVQELKQRLDSGNTDFVFIDVREPFEYAEFNLGAQLIPLVTVAQAAMNELDEYKEKEIVVHCRSGKRSATAQALMQQLGFKNVRNLEGGVLAWIDAFGNA